MNSASVFRARLSCLWALTFLGDLCSPSVRGADVGVAHEFLPYFHRSSCFIQVRPERVPEAVRAIELSTNREALENQKSERIVVPALF